jgi:hypothetical protein
MCTTNQCKEQLENALIGGGFPTGNVALIASNAAAMIAMRSWG